VDEDIIAAFALDEAEALLVREPFDGALSQLFLLTANNRRLEPPTDVMRRRS
jgi:hypothetical protein